MKKLIKLFSIVTMAAAGVFGLASLKASKKAESASADSNWYYRGNGKGMNWGNGSDDYVLHAVDFDASGTGWEFANGEQFKFTNDKVTWGTYYINGFRGSASWCFSGSGDGNLTCNNTGTYNLSLVDGYLYVDFADGTELYYVGSSSSWAPDTAHPIVLNGNSTTFSFSLNEEFKVGKDSSHSYGINDIKESDYFYNSFYGSGTNIKCRVAAQYTVRAVTDGHDIKLVLHGANDYTIYVLDLHGNLLDSVHKAYVYNANGNNGWPGADMGSYAGTTNMYQFDYWEKLTTLVVTQGENAGQTIDLTPQNGKCLILDGGTDSSWHWNSNNWVSPQVAKFIDNFMKFETYNESQGGDGSCKSSGWYTAAKNAYEAASFASYRQELCSISIVVERLEAWAAANNSSFTISNSVGLFSSNPNLTALISVNGTTNTIAIIVIISLVSVTAIGGYFFIRRRKENI